MSILKTPLQIKNIELKNRLVLPPMATGKSDDGIVSEELLNYYARMSEEGALGLVITEHSFICREGIASANQVSVADDEVLAGLTKLAETLHANGVKAAVQINHAGSSAFADEVWTAGSLFRPTEKNKEKKLHTMTKEKIAETVQAFADAAVRVKRAGFDAVELHAAHGYLLDQFYSPLTNDRTDEYGGPVENRVRIIREVIDAVREAVGDEFPVILRLGACDYIEGGNTGADALKAVKLLEKGIDVLDISGGMNGFIRPGYTGAGYFADITSAIRKEISIPVILTGGVQTAQDAEKLLADGSANLIGVARAMLSDPDWAKKALAELE